MSRYEFTDHNGYHVGPVIEARTGTEAAGRVVALTGHPGPLHCTHLSDDHRGGIDPLFCYGPDAIES